MVHVRNFHADSLAVGYSRLNVIGARTGVREHERFDAVCALLTAVAGDLTTRAGLIHAFPHVFTAVAVAMVALSVFAAVAVPRRQASTGQGHGHSHGHGMH